MLNERDTADLRLLEDSIVTLNTYSKIDDITTSKVFDNVVFKDSEDYLIEFQVPPNISQITVSVSTSVNVSSNNIHIDNIGCI